MKLTFLTGSSGCGKSERIYKLLLDISAKDNNRRLFLVVPEQFTMQAQRNIVERSVGHGTFNIDIVSFNRLAYRVFEELGISLLTTIDDTGKNLILRKVIDENRSKLQIIRPKDTQGFVSEVKSVISELLQYSVTEQMLSEACERIAGDGKNHNERLKRKLQDIMVIYRAYREYISEKYITTEEITGILCGCIGKSELMKDSIIAFDGFTGFTPAQYRLIELLFDKAEQMYFTVTMPRQADELLFGMSYDMLRKLGNCADRNHIWTEKIYVGEEVPYRFAGSDALAHLERNIFREESEYTQQTDAISIYSALGKKAEVQYVSARIKKLVGEGFRYRDIGVIAGSMEDYRELLSNTFAENDIPAFMDNKRSILANPAVEYIRAAIQVIEKDYSYESVFRLLKGYMCSIDREKTDSLENYVLALGIRGHRKWNETFHRKALSKADPDMEELNRTREAVCSLLEPLWEVFHKPEATVQEYILALNDFLDCSGVYEKLEMLKEKMEETQKAGLAKEYGQSYGNIIGLFEQTANLLGTEHMSIRQFSDVLDAGFNEIKVGIIPPTIDMVMVGDLERTRLDHIKILFFVGVNEGLVPAQNSNRGLFSEAEREILAGAELELAPTCRQKAYMQNFYLYLLLTKPSDKLIFTMNRENKPSKLIADIKRMFPGAQVSSDDTTDNVELVYNGVRGMQYLFEKLGDAKELTDRENSLFAVLYKDSALRKRIEEIADTALRNVTQESITKNAARLLYGELLTGSVSRMETYASCAFEHFARYGLGLEERRLYELGAADLGTLFHQALREYSSRLAVEGMDFGSVSDEKRAGYIEEAVETVMTDYNNSIFYDSSRNEYMRDKILNMLKMTVWALGEQTKAGSFIPSRFEKEFVFEKEGMQIRGQIDRIDYAASEGKSYVKIIDYKSGKKSLELGRLYDGLQLQLMIYLESLSKDNIPAAAMYYCIDNPIVDYDEGMDVKEAILQALKPQGIVNGELDSVELLDRQTKAGRSNYIPISYNKDGSVVMNRYSSATTQSRLRLLGTYAAEKMVELGKEVADGKVAPNPYPDSCTYCPYGMICGFRIEDKECSYRKPTKLQNDDGAYQKFSERIEANDKKLDR